MKRIFSALFGLVSILGLSGCSDIPAHWHYMEQGEMPPIVEKLYVDDRTLKPISPGVYKWRFILKLNPEFIRNAEQAAGLGKTETVYYEITKIFRCQAETVETLEKQYLDKTGQLTLPDPFPSKPPARPKGSFEIGTFQGLCKKSLPEGNEILYGSKGRQPR